MRIYDKPKYGSTFNILLLQFLERYKLRIIFSQSLLYQTVVNVVPLLVYAVKVIGSPREPSNINEERPEVGNVDSLLLKKIVIY